MGVGKRNPTGHSLRQPWLPYNLPTRSTSLRWPLGPAGRGWAAATPTSDHTTSLVSRKGWPHPRPLLHRDT